MRGRAVEFMRDMRKDRLCAVAFAFAVGVAWVVAVVVAASSRSSCASEGVSVGFCSGMTLNLGRRCIYAGVGVSIADGAGDDGAEEGGAGDACLLL